MEQTLLLNASFEPLKVIDWQRAMMLFFKGRVEIVAEHEREIRAVRFTFRMPSVVRLLRYVKVIRRAVVPFSRANVYARDGHACQYCGQRLRSEDLTFDHVVPVAQGGQRSWENIVSACLPCNKRKGGRTPTEAGMALARVPRRPAAPPEFTMTIGIRKTPEAWRDYFYWNAELSE